VCGQPFQGRVGERSEYNDVYIYYFIIINKIITYKIASATVRAVGVAEAAREVTDWCFAGESSRVIYLD